jgi:hypothetical protein
MYRNIRRPDRLTIPEVYLDDVFMKERYKRVEIPLDVFILQNSNTSTLSSNQHL